MNDDQDPCLKAAALMHAFMDAELDEATAEIVRYHLDACESCLDGYDLEVIVRDTIQRCCKEEAPDSLRQRIVSLRIRRN
ncbi:MAG: mycothiol system anti-sigma-R factor [Propionibacteriaceae bacterium]